MKVKEKSAQVGLKLNIQQTKIMHLVSPLHNYDQPRQHIKKQRHYFTKTDHNSPSSQTMVF